MNMVHHWTVRRTCSNFRINLVWSNRTAQDRGHFVFVLFFFCFFFCFFVVVLTKVHVYFYFSYYLMYIDIFLIFQSTCIFFKVG